MCLITKQKKPIITKKDLIVYKTLCQDYSATNFRFSYILGVLYFQKLVYDNEPKTYMGEKVMKEYGFNHRDFETICKNLTNVHDGFHFYRTKKRALEHKNRDEIIVSCFIPKGSEVFYDKTKLGVTNQIKIIDKI